MDDKEYYSMKRITSVDIVNMYKKKNPVQSGEVKVDDGTYLKLNTLQGHDDAEMLMEKHGKIEVNED